MLFENKKSLFPERPQFIGCKVNIFLSKCNRYTINFFEKFVKLSSLLYLDSLAFSIF